MACQVFCACNVPIVTLPLSLSLPLSPLSCPSLSLYLYLHYGSAYPCLQVEDWSQSGTRDESVSTLLDHLPTEPIEGSHVATGLLVSVLDG